MSTSRIFHFRDNELVIRLNCKFNDKDKNAATNITTVKYTTCHLPYSPDGHFMAMQVSTTSMNRMISARTFLRMAPGENYVQYPHRRFKNKTIILSIALILNCIYWTHWT